MTCAYPPYNTSQNAHPFNVELIADEGNHISLYKYHMNVNHKMDQLQQPVGMGHDFWRVSFRGPQSPDCEDWGPLAQITTLTVREAAGSCNCHIWGTS